MKFLDEIPGIMDADSGEDAEVSAERLEIQLAEIQNQMIQLPAGYAPGDKARLKLKAGGLLVDLQQGEEAFDVAREAFDVFIESQGWEDAILACDIMFQADQMHSLAALGQGVWLAVTFPIDPALTVNMLNHIIDETPDDSDGAGVAAAVAHYVVDIRCEAKDKENLSMFTNKMLATVARRHSNVETQDQFSYWIDKLELSDPSLFLPRLRNVVDVLVQEDWWVDRDAIWASLPDQ